MPSDRTRTSDDLSQRYKAVVMQQGRVILDRDFNALQEIVDGRIAADALDEIGPCGTPDNGFAISLPAPESPALVLWSYSAPNPWDFLIAPGTMYVGGQRVVLPAARPESAAVELLPPARLDRPRPRRLRRRARNPPSCSEYRLPARLRARGRCGRGSGPPATSPWAGRTPRQRVRLMRRIMRKAVDATDCASALPAAEADWAAQGYLFDPTTMRLLPQARLQVSFTATAGGLQPLRPGRAGRIPRRREPAHPPPDRRPDGLQRGQLALGLRQRELPLPGQPPAGDGKTLLLNQVPVDAFHCPATNQVVEVLRTAAVLGTEPDATDPTGSGTIVRCVAEATGFVTTVATYSNSDNTVTLTSSLPAPYLNDSNPLFLRIWQGQQSISLSSQPITLIRPDHPDVAGNPGDPHRARGRPSGRGAAGRGPSG